MLFSGCFVSIRFYCFTQLIYLTDGAGGKGTWGKLLDTGCESPIDRNDPNYDSEEVIARLSLFVPSFLISLRVKGTGICGGGLC